jgi:hypothetical protein
MQQDQIDGNFEQRAISDGDCLNVLCMIECFETLHPSSRTKPQSLNGRVSMTRLGFAENRFDLPGVFLHVLGDDLHATIEGIRKLRGVFSLRFIHIVQTQKVATLLPHLTCLNLSAHATLTVIV